MAPRLAWWALFDAIWFNQTELMPEEIDMAYRLEVNEWQGRESVQLMVEFAHEHECEKDVLRPRERLAFG